MGTVQNTKEFVEKIRKIKESKGKTTISIDVVRLFTNIPLRQTIDIILRKVYKEKKIKTNIRKENIKKLLFICTQGLLFQFNGEMYAQIDSVMMGSSYLD